MINEMVKKSLNEYNFRLSEKDVECISTQIILLYGKHPTEKQVNEVVGDVRIFFIEKNRKR